MCVQKTVVVLRVDAACLCAFSRFKAKQKRRWLSWLERCPGRGEFEGSNLAQGIIFQQLHSANFTKLRPLHILYSIECEGGGEMKSTTAHYRRPLKK